MNPETREFRPAAARATRAGARTRRVVRGGLLAAAAGGLSVLLFPGVASAQTPTTLSTFPADLWVTPLAGGCMALIVVVVTAVLIQNADRAEHPDKHHEKWNTIVPNTSAWDSKDSWVTNVTALGTVLTALFTQSAVGDFLNTGVDKDGFTILSLLFGGAAIMGPVVYGAFAKQPPDKPTAKPTSVSNPHISDRTDLAVGNPVVAPVGDSVDEPDDESDASSPSGTRAGLLLAALVTLTATFGLLADLGLLVSNTVASGADKDIVYVGLVLATAVTSLYAVRSTKFLAVDTASAPRKKKGKPAKKARATSERTESLISGLHRRSGTL